MCAARSVGELISALADIPDENHRRKFIANEPELQSREAMDAIQAEVVRLAYSDISQAGRLEQAGKSLADELNDDYCRALSLRCSGHLSYFGANYEAAIGAYEEALQLLDNLGLEMQAARTQNSGIQSLIYLGRYDQALDWANAAKRVFEAHGDRLRMARLDSNIANVMLRQDCHEDAIKSYRQAYSVLAKLGEPRDLAVVLSNMAVCYIAMSQFAKALTSYRRARAVCRENGFSSLASEANYNIAWLHYLRGDYRKATELYRDTREHCRQTGDAYHSALCDLSESEIYLDLNLSEEGAQLARRAARQFGTLGMNYERAKALVNAALASIDMGDLGRAMLVFRHARRIFVQEGNRTWPAVIDLYRAIICNLRGQNTVAKRFCERAEKVLSKSLLAAKAILCELLKAQIVREAGETSRAREIALGARDQLQRLGIRSLSVHASFLVAQLQEESGDIQAAYEACQSARQEIEMLRRRLWGEDVQVSFLKDKLCLYEMLVRLCLGRSDPKSTEEAFSYIEEAKSRSLAESLALRSVKGSQANSHAEAKEVQDLRRQLQGLYRQIDQVSYTAEHSHQLQALRGQASAGENRLTQRVQALRRSDPESAALLGTGSISPSQIQSSIPTDATFLQFYSGGEKIYCCLVDGDHFDILPIAAASDVYEELRQFRFQMAKVRLGPDYLKSFSDLWYKASLHHLRRLYSALIAPIRHLLSRPHLIIAPHGPLHHLPFHALLDGERYLAEDFTLSYTPSGSIFEICSKRPSSQNAESLVLGVPDLQAPQIREEVAEVAKILPDSRLFVGKKATARVLKTYSASSRFIHVATHGLFQSDNPLLSSIQLGNSKVGLMDFYDLTISADLVTLSGCSTGMNAVVGGDELIGLVRALLYAGARSLLVSLWEVSDKSTAYFMKVFYGRLMNKVGKAEAVQQAMAKTRERFPHPFYWAPFIMIGKYQN